MTSSEYGQRQTPVSVDPVAAKTPPQPPVLHEDCRCTRREHVCHVCLPKERT